MNNLLAAFHTNEPEQDREIIIRRMLDAPRELVWEAWTNPDHLVYWWGPTGFTITINEIDIRPGGVWRFIMHGPDGTDYPNKVAFIEVVKPERMVCTHSGDIEDDPGQFLKTITFDEYQNQTALTMHMLFKTVAERDFKVNKFHAIEGGNQTIDRLAEHLAKMQS